ncbi:MAG TPA: hypothetical protein GXX19_09590 [Syntrophomonadaceae bacterium]|nr:hypothetical protein [Syntrophomonadaceae bacterium]
MEYSGTRNIGFNITELNLEKYISLQKLGDLYAERIRGEESNKDERFIEKTTSSIHDANDLYEFFEIATEIEIHEKMPWLLYHPFRYIYWNTSSYRFRYMYKLNNERVRLLIESLSAATLIREISLAAYHIGASIRWFEYDSTTSSGGYPNLLIPVNAREISYIRRRRWTALQYLALTTSNKQSLVFRTPKHDDTPSILFTSDSDLSFRQDIPYNDGMIITAPHHGSEANRNVYRRFTHDNIIWVRSDGRFRTRPGKSYLNTHGKHFCTLCRGSTYPKQDVRLVLISGKWTPIYTRPCCCVR